MDNMIPELDARTLKKGDVLNTEFCEKHLGIDREHAYFQCFVNQLGMSIQDIRTDLIVSTKSGQVRILSDDEAEIELLSKARKDARALLRTAHLHGRIDKTQLSEEKKDLNETMTAYHGARVMEAWNSQRKLQEASRTKLLAKGRK